MRGIARLAGLALAALAVAVLWAGAQQGSGAASRELTLAFDERGALLPASAPARDTLAAMAAESTDVFVLAHGWRNDAASAECRYRQQIEGISSALSPSARALFVKIVWPSAMFPLVSDACGGGDKTPYLVFQQARAPNAVRTWAEAAFPAAARSRRFHSDVQRLAALIAATDAADARDPRSARVRESAEILMRWYDAADDTRRAALPDTDGPGERPLVIDVESIVSRYTAIQRTPVERAPWSSVPSIAEVFSFWTMKARAGVVGATGVHDVLMQLARTLPRSTRLHLIGHSFGGKLVSAAIVGQTDDQPVSVESLTILQGAFSHLAFATADQIRGLGVTTTGGGAYAAVLDRRLANVVTVSYSEQDRENQRWYPFGTFLSDDMLERGVPRFAALGARGLEGPVSVPVRLRDEPLAARYSPGRPRVFNVDASGVVLGHSDIMQPRVFKMIADVVAIANRWRNSESKK